VKRLTQSRRAGGNARPAGGRSGNDGDVGDVEDPGSEGADADVEEVDDPAHGNAIDQV
jgi:hypothetical protein